MRDPPNLTDGLERIALQHDEVSGFPGLDGAQIPALTERFGGGAGRSHQRLPR
jgi:hypothetical protein